MNKINLIISREYLTRVRKKSFIIMTILGPLLFGALMIIPAWLATREDKEQKTIGVIEYNDEDQPVPDSLMQFKGVIPDQEYLKFQYLGNTRLDDIKPIIAASDYYAILFIPHNVFTTGTVELYAKKQPSLSVVTHITKSLETYIRDAKLLKKHIPLDVINSARTPVHLKTIKLEKGGFEEQKLTNLRRGVGYISAFLIYFFIFFFGAQVMRGVIEEKTNRIVEVIVSSVRPFQLMIGKIIGIGLVGLTQFMIWVLLTGGIVFVAQKAFLTPQVPKTEQMAPENLFEPGTPSSDKTTPAVKTQQSELTGILADIQNVDFVAILASFLFFFLAGYLLYASFFAAIGSAADSETDTQQFMLPVTIPLIISIIVMSSAITNPEGQVAFWFSMIPLTSPVVMMARIPFGVPWIQVFISMALLILTFIGSTWMAGKIYRTGILMYGKKVSYKEIWKWLRYKS